MSKLFKLGLTILVAVIMAATSSCSDKKTSELLGAIGDDAVSTVFIKPVELLKSCGATLDNGSLTLPQSLKRALGKDASSLTELRGIDYDLVAVGVYRNSPDAVVFARIKDVSDLASSLKKLGYKKQTVDGHVVFVEEEGSGVVAVSDDLLFSFDCWNQDNLEVYIERVFDRASAPVTAWKADAISSKSSGAVYGLVASPDSKIDYAVAFSVHLDGSKAVMKTECLNLDGKEVAWLDGVPGSPELSFLGQEMRYVSEKDIFAFASVGFKDMSLYRAIDKYDLKYFLPSSMRGLDEDFLKSINGGMFCSVNMADASTRRYDNFKNYQFNAGFTAIDGRGDRILKDIVNMARDAGLSVRADGDGYAVKIDGTGTVMAECKDDIVVFSSAEKSGESRMSASSADDCYAWMAVNIPENFGPLKEYRINCGIKGRAYVRSTSAELSIEFTGTDKPFLESLVELVQRVDL